MYLLQVDESQLKKLYKLVDDNCKRRGLEGLEDTVELYNVLLSASKLEEKQVALPAEQPTTETPSETQ